MTKSDEARREIHTMFQHEPVACRGIRCLLSIGLFHAILVAGLSGRLVAQTPGSWSMGTPMLTPRDGAFIGVIGQKVYIAGGAVSGSDILNVNEVYDTTTNTWATAAPMLTGRVGGATAVVNNILYAIGGGITGGGNTVNTVEAYNPATDTWSTVSPLPFTVDSMTAVVENGIIYVVGGFRNGSRLNSALAYNPATNGWSTLASLKVAKSNVAAGLFASEIVAAGGLSADSTHATTDNEGYNAASNSWTSLAPLPSPRFGACFGGIGGVLYLAGGASNNTATPVGSMVAYDSSTNSWTSGLPAMPNAVTGAVGASVGGRLYCFGGSNKGQLGGTLYNYVQIYEPAAASEAPATNVLPQLAFGGGWYTALYFTNLTSSSVSFPVSFVAGDGTPLAIPALGVSSVTVNLDARGTAIIEAPNTGSLVEGYATAALPAGVTGYGVFRYTAPGSVAGQEAVVPLSGVTATTSTMIFDETSYTTGVAVVGLGSSAVTVNVTARNQQGNTLGTGPIELAANGKTAVLLRDIPGLSGVVGQLGSVDFSVNSGNVAALGIRTNGLAFTSIPTSDR